MIISEKMVKSVVEDIKEIVGPVQKASGPMAVFKAVAEAVPHIIHEVEGLTAELKGQGISLASADKKQIALDILFALVPLPVWLPRVIAEMIAGHLIDAAVSAVNKYRKG